MEPITKGKAIDIIALLCALWFLMTSWIWIYYANIVISFPIGLIALWLWKKGRLKHSSDTLNKVTFIVIGCRDIGRRVNRSVAE
jgi:hypothetical protein